MNTRLSFSFCLIIFLFLTGFGDVELVGKLSKDKILDNCPDWKAEIASYFPNQEAVEKLQSIQFEVNIEVFLGTWCPDSVRNVSAYFKIMEMVDNPTLHLYIELKDNYIANEEGIAVAIYEQIKKVNANKVYNELASLERLTDYKRPIEVTLLPDGAFASYKKRRQEEGADLIDWKPPHINPTETMLAELCTEVKVTPEPEPVTTRRPKVPA